jgi:hypothetical protein
MLGWAAPRSPELQLSAVYPWPGRARAGRRTPAPLLHQPPTATAEGAQPRRTPCGWPLPQGGRQLQRTRRRRAPMAHAALTIEHVDDTHFKPIGARHARAPLRADPITSRAIQHTQCPLNSFPARARWWLPRRQRRHVLQTNAPRRRRWHTRRGLDAPPLCGGHIGRRRGPILR